MDKQNIESGSKSVNDALRILKEHPDLWKNDQDGDLKKFVIDTIVKVDKQYAEESIRKGQFIWTTPIAVALTGLITLFGNFLFDYLRQDQSANQKAMSEENQFQYKIVERELASSKSEVERARTLLFLVNAGMLNSLNKAGLEKMANQSLRNSNQSITEIGVPSLGNIFIRKAKLYSETIEIIITLTQSDRPIDNNGQNYKRFWDLYRTDLINVESREVSIAMVNFGAVLSKLSEKGTNPNSELIGLGKKIIDLMEVELQGR